MHKHNLKKVVAVIAVLAMTLGTMITGFAATQTVGLNPAKDIAGTKYADAAARLQALDIMNGYPDGTFKLDNPVSRTEIATIVDRASGLEGAAKLAGNTKPAFKDVNASHHWAWGYINTAVSNGIVNGYPNKTFKPTGNVTFAEASAMFVRALGYEPSVGGAWPTNYLSKAAQIGVLDGVSAEPNAAATRGQIAIMMDNALDIKMMERSTYGDTAEYIVGDKTLLTDKLGIDKIEGKVVESPAISGRANEVKIELDKINNKDAKKDTTKTYDVVEAINPDVLLGLDITAWVNKDGAIFYAEYEDSQVKYDTVKSVDASKGTIKLTVADRSYDADDATIYVNGKEADLDDLSTDTTLYGTFAFDGKKVVMANLQQFNEADGDVVTKVDKDKKLVTAFDESGAIDEIDLTDPDDGYTITDAKGASMEIGDIKANDVIYVADFDDVYHVVVVSNAVTGKLAKMKATSLTVDDKSYDVADNATYSLNKDEDINKYSVEDSDVTDAAGEEVTALLDINGSVRHITTEVGVRAANYGLVTLVDEYADRIKIYDPAQDKTVSYDFDGDIHEGKDTIKIDALKGLTTTTAGDKTTKNFVVVKYDLDKDNVITDLYVFGTISQDDAKLGEESHANGDLEVAQLTATDFNENHDWIVAKDNKDSEDSSNYYMSSSTPVVGFTFNNDGKDFDDVESAKWDDIKDKNPNNASIVVVFNSKSNDVKFLAITDGYDEISSTDNYDGIVLDKYYDGSWKAKVSVWGEGEKEYKLQGKNDVQIGSVINFTLNSDNEIKVESNARITDIETVSAKGNTLTTDVGTYKLKDTKYFDATGETFKNGAFSDIDTASSSDIKKGDSVRIVHDSNLAMFVIKVDAKDTGDEEGTASVKAVYDEGKLTVNVSDNKDAYAVRVYDRDTGDPIGGYSVLKDGVATFDGEDVSKDPVFVTVKVYDKTGKLLSTENVATEEAPTEPDESKDASVKDVTVDGVNATKTEDGIYSVKLPNGTDLTALTADKVVVNANDSKATVGTPATSDDGATWKVTVTAEDGTTTSEITINVTVAE